MEAIAQTCQTFCVATAVSNFRDVLIQHPLLNCHHSGTIFELISFKLVSFSNGIGVGFPYSNGLLGQLAMHLLSCVIDTVGYTVDNLLDWILTVHKLLNVLRKAKFKLVTGEFVRDLYLPALLVYLCFV